MSLPNEQWQTFEWMLTATISIHPPRLKPCMQKSCASSRLSVVCVCVCEFSKTMTLSLIKGLKENREGMTKI